MARVAKESLLAFAKIFCTSLQPEAWSSEGDSTLGLDSGLLIMSCDCYKACHTKSNVDGREQKRKNRTSMHIYKLVVGYL